MAQREFYSDAELTKIFEESDSRNDFSEESDFYEHITDSESESESTKDCAVCSNRKLKGQRRETVYFCETCTRKPGLHPGTCFKNYHTLEKYK